MKKPIKYAIDKGLKTVLALIGSYWIQYWVQYWLVLGPVLARIGSSIGSYWVQYWLVLGPVFLCLVLMCHILFYYTAALRLSGTNSVIIPCYNETQCNDCSYGGGNKSCGGCVR